MPKKVSARSPSLTSQESYKAVIIADLVAEVQEEPEVEDEPEDEKKIENPSPVVLNVDLKNSEVNGTDMSKGIILRATNFQSSDIKSRASINVSTQPISDKNLPQSNFKTELSQMSVLRKIAFGFSFIPSILFILCFAIILPCEKSFPCLEERWNIVLNNTEITSNLQVPQNILFAFRDENGPALLSISEKSGEKQWLTKLSAPATLLECGHLATSDSQSCLILERNDTLHLFHSVHGNQQWKLSLKEGEKLPTILPDCNNDGVDEIAFVTSKNAIQVIYLGNILSLVDIPGCSDSPTELIKWTRQNVTDIVLICPKGENEILMRIPQNKWCRYDKRHKEKITTLLTAKQGTLSETKFLPVEEGLLVWLEEEVLFLTKEGHLQWNSPSTNHSSQNRFLLFGKYNSAGYQVLLYSSSIKDGLQITMLDFKSGNVTLSKNIPSFEMTEAIVIQGEQEDFVLGIKKTVSNSIKTKAVSQINEFSASLLQMLTKDKIDVSMNTTFSIVEEITLMTMKGTDLQTIQRETFNSLEGMLYKTVLTAILKDNKKELQVYILRKPQTGSLEKSTVLKSVVLSNWDSSSTQTSHCVWK